MTVGYNSAVYKYTELNVEMTKNFAIITKMTTATWYSEIEQKQNIVVLRKCKAVIRLYLADNGKIVVGFHSVSPPLPFFLEEKLVPLNHQYHYLSTVVKKYIIEDSVLCIRKQD